MKFNFKKIATVLGSAVLVGSTIGFAAAANYPAPFNQEASAIVVGSPSVAALSDAVAAANIASNIAAATTSSAATSSVSTTGGDSVKVEGSSNKFNLGDLATDVLVTSITSDKMPNLLADGTYVDDDNTEYKYTQKLNLSTTLRLNHFSDSDYKDKVPTIGINLSDSKVLDYILDFDTNPLFNASQMETTTITMMGKKYYVLDVVNSTTTSNNKLTLLDSANSAVVAEGSSSTIVAGDKSYNVSINYISDTKVQLNINGETTNSLSSGATYKLSDGSYVGIKDILYSSKDTGVSKVEISIGKGKLEIQNGSAVQLNDDNVNEITGQLLLDSSAQLDKIKLTWTTDGRAFITPDSSITMPGFESVKIAMADFFAPKAETTSLKNSGNDVIELKTSLKDGEYTIPLVYATAGNYTDAGKDSSNQLATSSASSFVFNQTAGDKYIVATWNSSTEAESYYLKVEMVQEDSVNKTKFTNVLDTTDTKTVSAGNDVTFGNVVITPSLINYTGSMKWATLTAGSGVNFNTLYTAEGMKITLPVLNTTYAYNGVTTTQYADDTTACMTLAAPVALPGQIDGTYTVYYNKTGDTTSNHTASCTTRQTSLIVNLSEADKDGNLGKKAFSVTLGKNSDNKVQVSSIGGADAGFEIGDTNTYEYYVISDLATKIVTDTGADQDSAVITYAGGQSYADVFITSPSATVTPSTPGSSGVGAVTVYDNEVSSVQSKNLIVVGGSCVNSVAAKLLGSATPLCGADFTAKAGVADGQFLIKVIASPYATGKIAMLVAGYNAADTTKAATYLTTNTVSSAVGTVVKKTSATYADVA